MTSTHPQFNKDIINNTICTITNNSLKLAALKNVYNPYNIVMKHVENKGYNEKVNIQY